MSPIHKKRWVPFSACTRQDFYLIRMEDLIVMWPEIKSELINRKSNCKDNCSKRGILKIRLRVQTNRIQGNMFSLLLGEKKKCFVWYWDLTPFSLWRQIWSWQLHLHAALQTDLGITLVDSSIQYSRLNRWRQTYKIVSIAI